MTPILDLGGIKIIDFLAKGLILVFYNLTYRCCLESLNNWTGVFREESLFVQEADVGMHCGIEDVFVQC